jgi:hypothetical protein
MTTTTKPRRITIRETERKLTRDQLSVLALEAAAAGDTLTVALCHRAIDGSRSARLEAARIIRDARARALANA